MSPVAFPAVAGVGHMADCAHAKKRWKSGSLARAPLHAFHRGSPKINTVVFDDSR